MMNRVYRTSLGILGGLLLASNVWAQEATASVDTTGAATIDEDAPARGMHNTISLLANLGFGYAEGSGFGVSGRYQYTIVDDGLLKPGSIHDDLGVEAGVDFLHYSWDFLGYSWSYNEFTVSGSLVWNFWFTENFAAYPRLGLGFRFGSFSDNTGVPSPSGYGGLLLVGGAGVLYELAPVTLRAELTNSTIALGAAISL